MKYVLIIVYILSVIFSWGAMVADIQDIGDKQFANKYYRRDLANSLMFSLIPVANICIVLFGTGFMEHGWTLQRRKD